MKRDNDRRDKIYIERRGIKNAGTGAIKVYLNHVLQWCQDQKMSDDEIKELDKQINVAIMTSKTIFMNIVMPRIQKHIKELPDDH
jgi:hypothetical protein